MYLESWEIVLKMKKPNINTCWTFFFFFCYNQRKALLNGRRSLKNNRPSSPNFGGYSVK